MQLSYLNYETEKTGELVNANIEQTVAVRFLKWNKTHTNS